MLPITQTNFEIFLQKVDILTFLLSLFNNWHCSAGQLLDLLGLDVACLSLIGQPWFGVGLMKIAFFVLIIISKLKTYVR